MACFTLTVIVLYFELFWLKYPGNVIKFILFTLHIEFTCVLVIKLSGISELSSKQLYETILYLNISIEIRVLQLKIKSGVNFLKESIG